MALALSSNVDNGPVSISCPSGCDSTKLTSRGSIPAKNETFAGAPIDAPLPTADLWRCPTCKIQFKWPYLNDNELLSLYEKAGDKVWYNENKPRYWSIIHQAIGASESKQKKVLDIGCYTGDFLGSLPQSWEKYGIEPNLKATEVSKKMGITNLGRSILDLKDSSQKFDYVFLLDVIEHTNQPLQLLQQIRPLLKDNGHLLLLTGNSAAFFPSFFGKAYWYINLSEHVVWLNKDWFQFTEKRTGLRLANIVNLSASNSSKGFFKALTLSFLFWLGTKLRKGPWGIPGRYLHPNHSPWLMQAKDHILVTLVPV